LYWTWIIRTVEIPASSGNGKEAAVGGHQFPVPALLKKITIFFSPLNFFCYAVRDFRFGFRYLQ
jgi:hypothetical protein